MFSCQVLSRLSRTGRGALGLCLVLVTAALAAQGQTKASCTFNFFSPTTPFKLHNGNPVFIQPLGINDFGRIVGYASPGTVHGLIRWPNGSVTRVKGTSFLRGDNDHTTSVGENVTDQGIVLHGSTVTRIVLDVNNGGVFEAKGINNYGTIIGRYEPPDHYGAHGFKRFNNGTTHTLDFPGAMAGATEPYGINDNGIVVGLYEAPDSSVHGFIFRKGQWATLDYPNASFTALVGITNAGKIIGTADVNSSTTHFLYDSGTFKVIAVPNSDPDTTALRSISPKRGLILGTTTNYAGDPAFIAQCD